MLRNWTGSWILVFKVQATKDIWNKETLKDHYENFIYLSDRKNHIYIWDNPVASSTIFTLNFTQHFLYTYENTESDI